MRITSYLFDLVHLVFKGENPTCMILFKTKPCNIGLNSDIYRSISFKLGMVIETTML